MASTTTLPAAQNDPAKNLQRSRRSIADLLQGDDFRQAVGAALPRHIRPDRFIRVALNATLRTPDLLRCSKESFFKCLLDLSALGLEPDGRRAHLIPRKNRKVCTCGHWIDRHRGKGAPCTYQGCQCAGSQESIECTLIVDYKGIAQLVRQSGDVSYIHADVVYDGDEWEFEYGSRAHLKHKPNLEMEKKGRKRIATYSYVKLKDGSDDFIVLSMSDIEAIRSRSASPGDGPWATDYDEMAKKSAFRRHSKWLPLSSESRDAIEKDDEYNTDVDGAMDLAASTTINMDDFRPSEDENRGHDDSMPPAIAGAQEAIQDTPQDTRQAEHVDRFAGFNEEEQLRAFTSFQDREGRIATAEEALEEMRHNQELVTKLQQDGGKKKGGRFI